MWHFDGAWWRHQMGTFSTLMALCEGNPPVTAELWSFRWSALEQTVDQAIETPVIWDAIALIITYLQGIHQPRVALFNGHTAVSYSFHQLKSPSNITWVIIVHYFPQCHLRCSLQWRHNDHDGVSNHQPHGCLLNRLFRRRSKKISKLRVTGLCAGIHRWPVNSPHKWPVTRKNFHLMTSSFYPPRAGPLRRGGGKNGLHYICRCLPSHGPGPL